MVDDFMVCVDRIITSACFESVTEREKLLRNVVDEVGIGENGKNVSFLKKSEVGFLKISEKNGNEGCCSKIVRECRICQEEDEEHEMEAPCACNGTLKFAHRKCIQRWCNKKGDITCEICNQVFSPNYAFPPAKSNPDVMAIDIREDMSRFIILRFFAFHVLLRQAWGPHIDLQDPRFLAFTAADRQFLQSEYEDYAVASSRSITCFRSVAIILMLILLIRQALMVTRDFEMVQESSTFFNVSLLELVGFLLPCYAMARSWYIVQSRRRRQGRTHF